MTITSETRRFFAEEIRAAGALADGAVTERVLDAFASVPREDHAGPGPWLLRSPLFDMATRRTPDADPAHLYHNVLIALDDERGINVGEPSLWARFLSRTPLQEGSSILQVGAGSGYYTAILAELAGEQGAVLATETDAGLADMAANALSANVTVRHGNGATDITVDDGPFDLIVAFAGVTHPVAAWGTALKPDGRMLLPITGDSWWGAMVLAQRDGGDFAARTLGRCGFFPCVGARDEETGKRVDKLWSETSRLQDKEMRIRFEGDCVRYEVDGSVF